jgi:uncharacterized protein
MLRAMPSPASSPVTGPAGTAVVTGATAGIGLAFARELAARGHDLVLVAREQGRLDQVAAELRTAYGVPVETLSADLGDRAQLARVEDRLRDGSRPVRLLVNNAGFGLKKRFLDNDLEDEQRLVDVLVTAVLRLSHAAMTGMVERGHGGVINVSSVAGFLPRGTYGAAKGWVTSLSRWAAAEHRADGVRVMALCPGFTSTEFHERMDVRRGSGLMWLSPEVVVRRALADFDRGRVISIPGPHYRFVVAATRLIPSRALQAYQSIGRR